MWWVLFTGNTSQLQNRAWLQHNRTCVHHYRKYTLFSNTKEGNEWKKSAASYLFATMTENILRNDDRQCEKRLQLIYRLFLNTRLISIIIYKDVVMLLSCIEKSTRCKPRNVSFMMMARCEGKVSTMRTRSERLFRTA